MGTLTNTDLSISAGVVSIKGMPSFNSADVTQCDKACPTACTPQVTVVTPVPPSAPCDCPWNFSMTVTGKPCLGLYRLGSETFPRLAIYDFQIDNGTATVAQIIASIVAQINADPYSIVSAVDTGGSHTTITLTEKDCDSDHATCGFEVAIAEAAGTVNTSTPHVDAVLSASALAREAPITPGSIFGDPQLLRCGTYCKFTFTINPLRKIPDDHLANAQLERYMKLEVWVNSADANYAADWLTPLTAEFTTCFA